MVCFVAGSGKEQELEVTEPELPEGEEVEEEEEEEEEEGEEDEKREKVDKEGEAEEKEEEYTIFKPKMKFFSGKTAAGLRIRTEPSFLVSLI